MGERHALGELADDGAPFRPRGERPGALQDVDRGEGLTAYLGPA
jgi:hypothetical protein